MLLWGCRSETSSEERGQVVASVQDQYLYEDEVARQLATQPHLAPSDSQQLRQNIIDAWVRKQLLFQRARRNLSDSLLDKDRELERYYQELIRYEYETQFLRSRLDTSLSDSAIQKFYEANTHMFRLHEPLLKVLLLQVPQQVSRLSDFRGWLQRRRKSDLDSIYKYAVGYRMARFYDPDAWKRASTLRLQYQLDIQDWSRLVEMKEPYEQKVGDDVLFMYVWDYQLPGKPAKLSRVRPQVRKMLLNKRKTRLLEKHREEILRKARENREFEILRP